MKNIFIYICCISIILSSCTTQNNTEDVSIMGQTIEPETNLENPTPSTSNITDQIIDEIEEDIQEEKEIKLENETEFTGEDPVDSEEPIVSTGAIISVTSLETGEDDIVTGKALVNIFVNVDDIAYIVAEDISFNEMSEEDFEFWDIPSTATLAFNSYYAGGGYYYYGVTDGEILTLYRKYVQETTPETENIPEEPFQIIQEIEL